MARESSWLKEAATSEHSVRERDLKIQWFSRGQLSGSQYDPKTLFG